MKREELIGIKLECIGTVEPYESEFIVGKIYVIEGDTFQGYPVFIAEDEFDWAVFPEDYVDLDDMIVQLNNNTNGRFKLAKGE